MLDRTVYTSTSIALAVVVSVGAVPPEKDHADPYASVREPVPSCEMKIAPLAPAVRLVGLAKVLPPPNVTEKLFAKLKSGVIVAPSVNAVIAPRC